MAKKFQIPKLKITDDTPSAIRTHIDESIGMFEIHADKLFDKFDRTSKISLSAMEATIKNKVDDHFINQAKKEEIARVEHYEKQEIIAKESYGKWEEKMAAVVKESIKDMTSMIRWFLTIVLLIVGGFGGLTIVNTALLGNKANKTEVLSKDESKVLIDTRDKYYDKRFVIIPGETMERNKYQWSLERIFEKYIPK